MSEHAVISLLLLVLLLVPPTLAAVRYGRGPAAVSRPMPRRPAEPPRRPVTATPSSREAVEPSAPTATAVTRPGVDVEEQRSQLMALSKPRLYELARIRAIPGRSQMSREQMVEALLAWETK